VNLKVLDTPAKEIILEIEQKIEEFNIAHWEIKEKKPLAVVLTNEKDELIFLIQGFCSCVCCIKFCCHSARDWRNPDFRDEKQTSISMLTGCRQSLPA